MMSEQIFVAMQYVLPKHLLTVLAGEFAWLKGGRLTTSVIRWFVERYGVNLSEAKNPDPASYSSFNEFFTRPLADGARPIANTAFVCPVDGAISQLGPIKGDQIFQAKGHEYSTTALVGGDAALAEHFQDGSFATIYLSPKDYHRIHMPCDGRLTRMIHVPGELFSVNPATARGVPGLFARNERVVCIFETAHGPLAMVLVGATIVGSMATVWHGVVNPPRPGKVRDWDYSEQQTHIQKGAEMGRFLLGSTVVMLLPKGAIHFSPEWKPELGVRLGQPMGAAP
jgi:phosphatidylserine decarboxylase